MAIVSLYSSAHTGETANATNTKAMTDVRRWSMVLSPRSMFDRAMKVSSRKGASILGRSETGDPALPRPSRKCLKSPGLQRTGGAKPRVVPCAVSNRLVLPSPEKPPSRRDVAEVPILFSNGSRGGCSDSERLGYTFGDAILCVLDGTRW